MEVFEIKHLILWSSLSVTYDFACMVIMLLSQKRGILVIHRDAEIVSLSLGPV